MYVSYYITRWKILKSISTVSVDFAGEQVTREDGSVISRDVLLKTHDSDSNSDKNVKYNFIPTGVNFRIYLEY